MSLEIKYLVHISISKVLRSHHKTVKNVTFKLNVIF